MKELKLVIQCFCFEEWLLLTSVHLVYQGLKKKGPCENHLHKMVSEGANTIINRFNDKEQIEINSHRDDQIQSLLQHVYRSKSRKSLRDSYLKPCCLLRKIEVNCL